MRAAPSFKPRPGGASVQPAKIAERLVRRFGDRQFIRRIRIGSPPRYRLPEAPSNAAWAYLDAPAVAGSDPRAQLLAQWQAELIGGALRDDLCAAGGRPLVGWSFGPATTVISDSTFAFGQRFPNPTPSMFRNRLALVGRKYGFRVVSLQLLRPRQLAPLVVVETNRGRKSFVQDVGKIKALLDPMNRGATTFEGFFLEARDEDGPFVRVASTFRGHWVGSQWSWDRCVYPYTQIGLRNCPG